MAQESSPNSFGRKLAALTLPLIGMLIVSALSSCSPRFEKPADAPRQAKNDTRTNDKSEQRPDEAPPVHVAPPPAYGHRVVMADCKAGSNCTLEHSPRSESY